MRKFKLALATALWFVCLFSNAQTPQFLSYQAVVRGQNNLLVTSTEIGVRISVLLNAVDGDIVYSETHVVLSNANGLITVEIGNGESYGDISLINWAAGTYFLKTEFDPEGSNNYTIVGVSQLLSVPYALHAKTAETITGSMNEADPVFLASPSHGISNENVSNWNTSYTWGDHEGLYKPASYNPTWSEILYIPFNLLGATNHQMIRYNETTGKWVNWTPNYIVSESQDIEDVLTLSNNANNKKLLNINQQGIGTANPNQSAALEIQSTSQGFLPPRMTTSQIHSIANPAEGLVVYNLENKTLNVFDATNWVDMSGNPALKIGNTYQSGIIFYIDGTGYHGYVCNVNDIIQTQWGCDSIEIGIMGSFGVDVGTGLQNTLDIVSQCQSAFYAALLCYDLILDNYQDWFLPSQSELMLMYTNLHLNGIGNFSDGPYWSSTEVDIENAIGVDFGSGSVSTILKDENTVFVRAVRAF